jgi:transcriptional antiterminator NusG
MAENNYKWYVLKAISGKENKVKEYIEGALVTSTLFKEYVSQVLIPTEKVVALRGNKRVVKERNLLPGYVLVECNLTDECYPLLRNIPNVLGFVTDSKSSMKAKPVSQEEVNRLVGAVDDASVDAMMDETFLVGERVKVTDGPFNGFEGVVNEVAQDKRKLKVVVTIFDRQTPLELGYDQVAKE